MSATSSHSSRVRITAPSAPRKPSGAADRRPRAHVFGPVPSRRLGRSLGVDLVPYKTCSYDCIYCQLGRTTRKTVERKEWVPVGAVLDEIQNKLDSRPDYITFSGSGEPTLHSGLAEIIEGIRSMCDIPVAVLTNGSLLWNPTVRAQLARADLVIPSLDAGDDPMFQAVNRPHRFITFERMLSGLEAFRREFGGRYWLEVMLLAGHTGPRAHVEMIAEHVRRIRPDRVQLNTATRPPAEDYASPVPPVRLKELANAFHPRATVIAEYRGRRVKGVGLEQNHRDILDVLRRRPCSEEDLASCLQMRPIELAKHIVALETAKFVASRSHGGNIFYSATRNAK